MNRSILSCGLALAALAASASAEPAPVSAREAPAMPVHDASVACGHCHQDPHAGAGGGKCQDCHTTESFVPSTFTVKDHAATPFPLENAHSTASCGLCHANGKLTGVPTACSDCHLDRHRGELGRECTECHTTVAFAPVEGFDHAGRTGFALSGPHAGPACADCHQGARGRVLLVTADPGCETCHAAPHGDLGPCETCHEDTTFAAARKAFDHRTTAFALERRHSALPCESCHPVGAVAKATADECATCHADPHAGQLSVVCADCHRPDRWRLVRFDHDATLFPLRGRHFVAPCSSCHADQRWIGTPTTCWGCHALDAARGPSSVAAHRQGAAECQDCHTTWSW